jgi:hypothetical protein
MGWGGAATDGSAAQVKGFAMSIPQEWAKEIARFPVVLRELVEAELAAGNGIEEVGHSFPAAPCGAYVKLTREVSTRPRVATPELKFYDRDGSSYSGEFSDLQRHFFVLEPAHPPKPPPDYAAIRAELEARYVAESQLPGHQASEKGGVRMSDLTPGECAIREANQPNPQSVVTRFAASMEIDYEKWREGVGYDLTLLEKATVEELKAIEELVIHRATRDWRDVETLVAIGSARAMKAVRTAGLTGSPEIQMAVLRMAPQLLSEEERTASLVHALETAELYGGLSQALGEVEEFHPPEIQTALLRGLMDRDGGTAVHFAAMLYYLRGRAPVPFDMAQRPFFLRFNTPDLAARAVVVQELCTALGEDPDRCIPPRYRSSKPAKTDASGKADRAKSA